MSSSSEPCVGINVGAAAERIGVCGVRLIRGGDGVGAGAGSAHRLEVVEVSLRQCGDVGVGAGAGSAHRLEVEVGVSSRHLGGDGVQAGVYSHKLEVGVSSLGSGAGSAHRSDRNCGCVSVGVGVGVGAGSIVVVGVVTV